MSLTSNVEALVARWRNEGVEILPPANEMLVRQTYSAAGGNASADVVALYRVLGGMSEMDNEYWKMCSLQEIKDAKREHPQAGVLFANYCMDCYRYRLKPVDELTSSVWIAGFDYGPPVLIASSLAASFDAYILIPDLVLKAPASRAEYHRPATLSSIQTPIAHASAFRSKPKQGSEYHMLGLVVAFFVALSVLAAVSSLPRVSILVSALGVLASFERIHRLIRNATSNVARAVPLILGSLIFTAFMWATSRLW